MPERRHGRAHLRVPLELEASCAWGYQTRRCIITEFSTGGLTILGLDAPVGTPLAIGLPLPDGTFTVCGVVLHRSGAGGAAGVRLASLPAALGADLELYLWSLLAAEVLPPDEKTCTALGCERPRKARGLCSLHYGRRRREERRRTRQGKVPALAGEEG